jgi:hypothetical protein
LRELAQKGILTTNWASRSNPHFAGSSCVKVSSREHEPAPFGAASPEIPPMAHPKSRSVPRTPHAARSPSLFKRGDLRRAIRSAREAGLPIDRVEIDKTGKSIVHAAKHGQRGAE